MSAKKIFLETLKHHLEHFKVIIRGEFEVKSEETDFTHEFNIESDHINTALNRLKNELNIAVLEKCKNVLNELLRGN